MESYAVQLIGTENPKHFKHFGARASADAFASNKVQSEEAELACIYSVIDAANPNEAVDMVKMGKATLIGARSRHASEAEALAATETAWKRAREAGPEALLDYLGYKLPPAKPAPRIRRRF
jgi:hypothetical protein